MTKSILTVLFPLTIFINGCGQTTNSKQNSISSTQDTAKDLIVGGSCDRCDVMFYGGKPSDDKIKSETTIANKNEPGDRMEINGTVVLQDGLTPAKNIVLYIYHTNAQGLYAPSDTQTIVRMNGHLRSWVKTDAEGKFRIYSIRPAPYPNRDIPAHIHIIVKEPGKIPYYIDEVWFDDDPLITNELKHEAEKRGGDLIIHLAKDKQNVWTGNLKIKLGLNIPDYK